MAVQTVYEGLFSSDFRNAQTSDGVLISTLWKEADTLQADYNRRRQTTASFMGFVTTKPDADIVTQVRAKWMRKSEHGTPDTRLRVQYDLAVQTGLEGFQSAYGYTELAQLIALDSGTIRGAIDAIFEENARFRYVNMWKQFFRSGLRRVVDIVTKATIDVTPFYNGDSAVPPRVGGKVFTAPHNHFMRVATNHTVVSADLTAGFKNVTEHGWDREVYCVGSETTINDKVLPIGAPDIATIQAINPIVGSDAVNANQPGALVNIAVRVGDIDLLVVATFKGKYRIATSPDIPDGYLAFFSHEGPLSPNNSLQIREPSDPQLQGVRRTPNPQVPFVEVYYDDFVGWGVRQRGNGVAMQVDWTGGSAYQDPTWPEDDF